MKILAYLAVILAFVSCSREKAADPARVVALGERATAGALIYNAFETQWAVSLPDKPNPRVPTNRFLLVHLTIVNSSAAPVTIPSLSVVDDSGEVYNELTNGTGVPNWMGILHTVKPADSEQGNVLFDAPPKHYKLKVTGESEDKFAYIDMPLNFAPENPKPTDPGVQP